MQYTLPKVSSILLNILQIKKNLLCKNFPGNLSFSESDRNFRYRLILTNQMAVTQSPGCSMSGKETQFIPGEPNASYLVWVQLLQQVSIFRKRVHSTFS